MVSNGMSINGEEMGSKNKAEEVGISKEDFEGRALKVGGKPGITWEIQGPRSHKSWK